jgi:hypothetical protein
MLRIVVIGIVVVSTGVCRGESPEIEKKLHGVWRGGPCVGRLELKAEESGCVVTSNRLWVR